MEAKNKTALPKFKIEHTQGDYWGGTQLSFNVFKVITVVLGLFAIDHLLLRSPTTAFVKGLCNMLTLGYFYFYDVIQVFAEEESVREHGISFPFAGIIGVGKGIFHTPDGSGKAPNDAPSPFLFAVYCLAVVFGFGLDFLVAGDFAGAAAKLFSIFPMPLFFLMPIFWVFTYLWWLYNIARTYFYTDIVLDKNPANKDRGVARFFPMNMVINQYYLPIGTLIPMENVAEPCERPLTFPWSMFAGIGRMIGIPIKVAGETAKTVVESSVSPIAAIVAAFAASVKSITDAFSSLIPPIGKTAEAAAKLVDKVPTMFDKFQSGMVQATSPEALFGKHADGKLKTPSDMVFRKGGSLNDNTLIPKTIDDGYVLLGLLALVLGGTGLTVFRSMKNEYPDSDTPPKPRASRKPFLPSKFGSF